MESIPWILIAILLFGVLIFVFAMAMKKRTEKPTDYYVFFIMGITWLALGVYSDNTAFLVMGLVFAVVGLKHKDTWKQNHPGWDQLTERQKKTKFALVALLGLLALGLVLFIMLERGAI